MLPRLVLLVISKEQSDQITTDDIEKLEDFNAEEADTRLILLASQLHSEVVIVNKDTYDLGFFKVEYNKKLEFKTRTY